MANSDYRQAMQQVERQYYKKIVNKYTPGRPVAKNCLKAFLSGGLVCLLGQVVQSFFVRVFGFSMADAGNPTVATMVLLATLLTGFGLYDKIGQWAGAGTSVPVTGFANAVSSVAIEHKSEGFVLGVGGNAFKLAGSVIVFGVVASFIIALIKTIVT